MDTVKAEGQGPPDWGVYMFMLGVTGSWSDVQILASIPQVGAVPGPV